MLEMKRRAKSHLITKICENGSNKYEIKMTILIFFHICFTLDLAINLFLDTV